MKPLAALAVTGILGVVVGKVLMMLFLPLLGMFFGFMAMMLKVLFIAGLIAFGWWLFNRMTERPSEG